MIWIQNIFNENTSFYHMIQTRYICIFWHADSHYTYLEWKKDIIIFVQNLEIPTIVIYFRQKNSRGTFSIWPNRIIRVPIFERNHFILVSLDGGIIGYLVFEVERKKGKKIVYTIDRQWCHSTANPSHCYFTRLNLKKTRIYGHLRWPFFSPFGYGRVPELFRMTNILKW